MQIDFSPVVADWPALVAGLAVTCWLSLISAILALIVGASLAAANYGLVPLRRGVRLYVELMRGIPFLVLLLCCFYILPDAGIVLDPVQSGVAALMLYYGAYVSEVLRGAVRAVPFGQIQAAVAVGMPTLSILLRITLPQALGPALPPLAGLLIGLVKDSALLSIISVHEFAFAAKETVADTYAPFETYAVVGVCYWLLNGSLDLLLRRLERHVVRFRSAHEPASRQRLA